MTLRAVPDAPPRAAARPLLGRERELEQVVRFLRDPGGPAVLVLEGAAGIGKTALWLHALDAASAEGDLVLSCRCAEDETALGFQALADLVGRLDEELLEALPTPQRGALKAALLLEDGGDTDPRATRAGATEVLRRAAAHRKVLVAIDDSPWLDPETLAVLRFSARRLRDEPIRFLLTARSAEDPRGLEVPELGLPTERLKLGALSYHTIAQVLHDTLDVRLSRRTLQELYELSEGNPLLAVQLARAAAEHPHSEGARGSLPLPERLQVTMAERIGELSQPVRAALLAVACGHGMTLQEIRRLFSQEILDQALGADLLSAESDRIRLAHPLFGEVVLRQAVPAEVRYTHRRLAEVVRDPEHRAFHLAEATTAPSSQVSGLLESAALHAARRAAISTAAALAERAFKLTPREDERWVERLLLSADYSNRAGALRRTDALLTPVIDQLPPGPQRGRARFLLADASSRDQAGEWRKALEDVPAATPLRAAILGELAKVVAVGKCQALAEAEGYAREALSIEPGNQLTVASLMWIKAMRGGRLEPVTGETGSVELHRAPPRIHAVAQVWRGELGAARRELERLARLADERGEGESYFGFRHHRCELELRAGGWVMVEELLGEWAVVRGESVEADAAVLRCQAHLKLGRGHAAEAIRLAEASIKAAILDASAGTHLEWQRLESLRILGTAQLLDHDPDTAATTLMQVWEHTEREGIHNPGTFPVAPDLAEALALSDRLEEARGVADTLGVRAEEQDHPWGRAAAAAAAGHIALAERADEAAEAAFTQAATRFAELEMPLDQGRALTYLGIAQRRLRRRREARETLEAAARLLTELGSPGWAARAKDELGRIAGRRASGQALTPTESKVAELVASGLGNKQIAVALTISVSAVEAHLTRVYAKLGVRSRTELAATVSSRASASATAS
jgi:DNA-binding CsgD family transcriptional regulator